MLHLVALFVTCDNPDVVPQSTLAKPLFNEIRHVFLRHPCAISNDVRQEKEGLYLVLSSNPSKERP